MYQARDLPAMDKDSFSGRWEEGEKPGTRDSALGTGPWGLWTTGNAAQGVSCRWAVSAAFVEVTVVATVTGFPVVRWLA